MTESRLTACARPHRAFAIITFIFGTALVLLIPPFQSQDEVPHFFRAYQITEGTFISHDKGPNGLEGGILPYSLDQISSPFTKMFRNVNVKASVAEIRQALRVPLNPRVRYFYDFPATVHYCPICYLGPCIGIGLGRAMGAPPLVMLYLGRETGLFTWIILGFFALRCAPAIAMPLFFLLLMPMSLYLAASVSGDPSTTGLAALFTALICKYFQRSSPLNQKEMAFLIVISILLSISKYAYVPLLGLLLLIPAKNFGGFGRFAMKLAILAALDITALLIWSSSSATNLDTRVKAGDEASAPVQLKLLEQHPAGIPKLILETFRINGELLMQSYVGVIGSFDAPLPTPVIIGYVTLLLAACWLSDPQFPLPPPIRAAVIILPIVTCSCAIIALLEYLYWSPPGLFFIDGLNGRYWIPLTPAMLVLLCSIFRRMPRHLRPQAGEGALNIAAAVISLGVCFFLLGFVWMRFYG